MAAQFEFAEVIQQIAVLTDARTPEATYFPEFLRRVVQGCRAAGALVWSQGPGQRIDLAFGVHVSQLGYQGNVEAERLNQPLVGEVLRTGIARLYGAGKDDRPPTPHLLLLAPLHRGQTIMGVVELFLPASTPADQHVGLLQFAEEACGFASRYLQLRQESAEEVPTQQNWDEMRRFVLDLQRSLDPLEIAMTVANDGRQRIRCDRVSVVLGTGRKSRVLAVSGQEQVNHKANVVRQLELLTARVVATGEPMVYAGKLDEYPPQIEKPLADYLLESGSRYLRIEPLFRSEPLVDRRTTSRRGTTSIPRKMAIGALVVEQIAEGRPRAGIAERAGIVAEHTAAALTNALAHRQILLLPLWTALGRCAEPLQGRGLVKLLTVAVLIGAVASSLAWIPWEYRVEAAGRLMPEIQQRVFAPWDGQVTEIYVRSGDFVEAGAPLIQLRNEDLQAKLLSARNEQKELRELLTALDAELTEALNGGSRTEAIATQGRMVQTRIQLTDAESRVAILQGQIAQLTVRAPISGVVATFQLSDLLSDRPVQLGEALLEVMDVRQAWRLELDLPEHRLGHVLAARKLSAETPLPVDFVLATASESQYLGNLTEIGTRAEDSSPTERTIPILASLDPSKEQELREQLRIGTEVRARIRCGQKSLGYVLFGDLIEFLQQQFWL